LLEQVGISDARKRPSTYFDMLLCVGHSVKSLAMGVSCAQGIKGSLEFSSCSASLNDGNVIGHLNRKEAAHFEHIRDFLINQTQGTTKYYSGCFVLP
jgi:hypothetical protein